MKLALEGKPINKLAPPPPEYHEYKLARIFGWSKQVIDDTPGHWSDWMLQIAEIDRSGGRA